MRKLDTALGFGIRRRETTIRLWKLRFRTGWKYIFGATPRILILRVPEVNANCRKSLGQSSALLRTRFWSLRDSLGRKVRVGFTQIGLEVWECPVEERSSRSVSSLR